MEVKKAIEKIAWRFLKGNFTPNKNDQDAINDIIDYFNQTQNKQFEANELFAKMYIHTAMKIMESDGTTVFENSHRKKIGNLLSKPIDQIIENLQKSLNDSEQYGLLKDAGHDFRHPALRIEGETRETIKKLNELLKTHENIERLTGEVWDFDTVKTAIEVEVNQMINLHR